MNALNPSDWIALGALLFSIVAMVISFVTSTKKFELLHDQRGEILKWYSETVQILIDLRFHAEKGLPMQEEALTKLSAQIEVGRFYFPNVIKPNGRGQDKLAPYQGSRDAALDFLVFTYDICTGEDPGKYTQHLLVLQKSFTAYVFGLLNPRKYGKKVKRYAGLALDRTQTLGEFLASKPEASFFENLF